MGYRMTPQEHIAKAEELVDHGERRATDQGGLRNAMLALAHATIATAQAAVEEVST